TAGRRSPTPVLATWSGSSRASSPGCRRRTGSHTFSSGRRASASGRRPQCSGPRSRSCGSVRTVPTSSCEPPWAQPAGRSMTMTDHGMPSRFGSELAPPEALFVRVRSAVAATPAAKTTTRLRVIVATAIVPVLTAAVLLVASHLVYHRPALRIHEGTLVTVHLVIVLLLIVGLTLSATLIALGRGERGLGSSVVALFLAAVLVTPI